MNNFYYGLYFLFCILLYVFVLRLVIRLLSDKGLIYSQALNLYGYSFIFSSLLILEYGIYITESQNTSHFNGATFLFVVLIFCLYFFMGLFVRLYSSLGLHKIRRFKVERKGYFFAIASCFCVILLLALYMNLVLSPIPLLSDGDVNRFNFWEHARFPFLASVFGERSVPLAIILGVLLNHATLRKAKKPAWTIFLIFVLYLFYLILLGHKYSPLLLSIFFFALPYLITNKVDFRVAIKWFIRFTTIAIIYVLYVYSGHSSGIVSEYGGPVGGALYRIFVLQGHVFWNMFDIFGLDGSGLEKVEWFFANRFDGLEMSMMLVSPDLFQDYIDAGIRFTGGFPAFLLAFPLPVAILFFVMILSLYSFVLVRVISLSRSGSLIRLILGMQLLYFFHFGLVMGDFRFLSSPAFYLFLFLFVLSRLFYIFPGDNRVSPVEIPNKVAEGVR